MSGHGPDTASFEKAVLADTSRPAHLTETMAFMFESRMVIKPSRAALGGTPALQSDYMDHWNSLKKLFNPSRP
jgi:homogentisate 1,2-dioxygenase